MKICFLILTLCLFQLWIPTKSNDTNTPPHIIFINADDLGWNDVGFHGSPQIPTPNVDALAQSGILLNTYYGHWLCTPSRAALLSGRYPIRLGLQHSAISPGERSGLPLNVTTLPQHMKKLGYSTHMIGKWHLGYMTKEHTPAYRGYDSYFGYWNSFMDHFDYTFLGKTFLDDVPEFFGIDMHDGIEPVRHDRGRYATNLFNEKAVNLIRNYNSSEPLFLYLAHIAVHIGNAYQPLQAPQKYIDQVSNIADVKRRIHAAMMVALDDSVGDVFKALHDNNMLDNSIIIFVSDNGGDTIRKKGAVSSNYPLRGRKETVWEGGFRVPAFVWSRLFQLKQPRISHQLMHVSDWLPTLYHAAGGDVNDLGEIDGHNMWEAFINDLPSPRQELLYNIDPIIGVSGLRQGDWKIVNGTTGYDNWYNPIDYHCFDSKNTFNKCEFRNNGTVRDILQKSGGWLLENPDRWRRDATIVCMQPPPVNNGECFPEKKPCLFNITSDLCEYHNLADKYPEIVDQLMGRIQEFEKQAVPPQHKPSDMLANPICHNFTYVPWLDPEHQSDCQGV